MVKRDAGAIEAFVLMAVLTLTALTMMIGALSALTSRHEQARAAADFAALSALQSPDGCAAADVAARRNGARLESCQLAESDVRVVASVPTGISSALLRIGVPARFVAQAHAIR